MKVLVVNAGSSSCKYQLLEMDSHEVLCSGVAERIGLPMGMLPLIGAIWPVVDIGHTCTNVTSDIVGAAIVGNRLGLMDKAVFDAEKKVSAKK